METGRMPVLRLSILFSTTAANITANTFLRGGDKFNEQLCRAVRVFGLYSSNCRTQILPAAEQRAIRRFQFQPLLRRETCTPQANHIQPTDFILMERHC